VPSLAPATPATGSICAPPPAQPGAPPPPPRIDGVRLVPGAAETARCTTAVAAVPSSDGNVYVLDLGRFQVPSRTPTLAGDARTRVVSAESIVPAAPDTRLALVRGDGAPTTVAAELAAAIGVTPGVTPDDLWRIEQQAVLPGLSGVRGVAVTAGGVTTVAAQVDSGRPGPAGEVGWIVQQRVAAPELGVAPGDVVQLDQLAVEGDRCEMTVEAVLAPDAAFPGGALRLAPGSCAAPLPDGAALVAFTVRSGGLLLASGRLGHLGRPTPGAPFAVRWTAAADPDAVPQPATVAQALARKARRFHYPADASCAAGGCAAFPGLTHPLADGPMVAFTVAPIDPATLRRGAAIVFTTASGHSPATRRPSGGVLPVGAAAVDRSRIAGGAGSLEVRYYVPYSDDQILIFGPGETGATSIR
jgi:hypothetical protein